MSLQYSNNICFREFAGSRPHMKLARQDDGRFSFYYVNADEKVLLPVITQHEPNIVSYYQWGLIPSWVKDYDSALAYQAKNYNAKSEGIFSKPSFRGYIKRKRCLVPATGYFVWHLKNGVKYPFWVGVKSNPSATELRSFCFAGIYSAWVNADTGEVFNTFSIITTAANELIAFINNRKKRMPVILRQEDETKWLDENLPDEEITGLMQAYAAKEMIAHTISRRFIFKDEDRNVALTIEPYTYKGIEPFIDSSGF